MYDKKKQHPFLVCSLVSWLVHLLFFFLRKENKTRKKREKERQEGKKTEANTPPHSTPFFKKQRRKRKEKNTMKKIHKLAFFDNGEVGEGAVFEADCGELSQPAAQQKDNRKSLQMPKSRVRMEAAIPLSHLQHADKKHSRKATDRNQGQPEGRGH
uniref:Uncharacterized protein n=1 Tax=Micrurus spixii TaxID=129469 RepID=A0A2D4MFW4_9SAUR